MKIEAVCEQLIDAITIADKVSGKNLTLPVLNCIFLQAKGKTVTIKSTNLDLGVEIVLPVKVEEEGEVAVPSAILHNTLNSLYEGKSVVLQTKDGNLIVRTPNGETVIKAQPHDDFPTIPKPKDAQTFKLKPTFFTEGIRSVWYSASLSSIKPELSSVYIKKEHKKIYFVSTDSFRLAEKIVILPETVSEFEPILIPLKNIPEIIRILERAEEDVEVSLTQNQISFSYGTTHLTSRLIDGTFPDYQQIIPKDTKTEIVVLKQDLLNVLKKTTIFSDNSSQVRFTIDPSKKLFSLSSKNSDVGETVDTLHASLTGESLEISFNYKYILDCFQAMHSDSISLSFGGRSRPMIMRGVSDTTFLYLVMPMNK